MTDMINDKPFYIWEGIYDTYKSAAAEAIGPGFAGETYRERSLMAANECLVALEAGRPIPSFHKQRSTLLPLTVAMICGSNESVKILDFGGGLGIGYMTLVESLTSCQNIKYSILEVPEINRVGMTLLGNRVEYIENLPSSNDFDLIHSASALQYIDNWQGLLEQLMLLNPKYIYLSDVFAGAINNYVTLQNYYGSRIPHWFLNFQELRNVFEKQGYKLIMKSYATSLRLNAQDTLPMDNFPEAYRLAQTMHLVFQRKN